MSYDDDDFGNHFTPLLLTLGRVIDNTLVDHKERKDLQYTADFLRGQRDMAQAKLADTRSDILLLVEAMEPESREAKLNDLGGKSIVALEQLLDFFVIQLRSIAETKSGPGPWT